MIDYPQLAKSGLLAALLRRAFCRQNANGYQESSPGILPAVIIHEAGFAPSCSPCVMEVRP